MREKRGALLRGANNVNIFVLSAKLKAWRDTGLGLALS